MKRCLLFFSKPSVLICDIKETIKLDNQSLSSMRYRVPRIWVWTPAAALFGLIFSVTSLRWGHECIDSLHWWWYLILFRDGKLIFSGPWTRNLSFYIILAISKCFLDCRWDIRDSNFDNTKMSICMNRSIDICSIPGVLRKIIYSVI